MDKTTKIKISLDQHINLCKGLIKEFKDLKLNEVETKMIENGKIINIDEIIILHEKYLDELINWRKYYN